MLQFKCFSVTLTISKISSQLSWQIMIGSNFGRRLIRANLRVISNHSSGEKHRCLFLNSNKITIRNNQSII